MFCEPIFVEGAVLLQSHQQFEEKTKTATLLVKKNSAEV